MEIHQILRNVAQRKQKHFNGIHYCERKKYLIKVEIVFEVE